tara:strand:- start:385 stop:759 length:375 start_codon:yes stop_codon:yes gene_type:complete
MNETTKKMLAELDAAIEQCLWIPNEHLPEEYHDDREGGKTLKRLNKQADQVEEAKAEIPARERPVIFYDTPEGRGTPERMAILNKYRDAVANGEEIPYEINEDRLYRNEQAFASAIDLSMGEEE